MHIGHLIIRTHKLVRSSKRIFNADINDLQIATRQQRNGAGSIDYAQADG